MSGGGMESKSPEPRSFPKPEKMFRCGFCLQLFETSSDLIAHKRAEHYEVKSGHGLPILPTMTSFHTSPSKFKTTDRVVNIKTSPKSPFRHSPSKSVQTTRPIDSYFQPIPRNLQLPDQKIQKRKRRGGKSLVCTVCSKILKSTCSFKAHMRLHTGETPYSCVRCKRAFHSSKAAYQHRFRYRKDGVCSNARTLNQGSRAVIAKRRKVVPTVARSANHPSKMHFGNNSVSQRLSVQHLAKTNGNATATISFKTENKSLSVQRSKVTDGSPNIKGNFKCPTCDKILMSTMTYNDHLNIHTGELPYFCTHCPKRFYSHRRWSDHLTKCKFGPRIVTSGKKKFSRPLLTKRRKPARIVRRASQIVKNTEVVKQNNQDVEIPYRNMPKVLIGNMNSSVDHLGIVHDPNAEATYPEIRNNSGIFRDPAIMNSSSKCWPESMRTCRYCQKVLTCPRTCTEHERMHTGERPYSCGACGQGYFSRTAALTHRAKTCKMKNSNGGKSFGIRSAQVKSPFASSSSSGRNNFVVRNTTLEKDSLALDGQAVVPQQIQFGNNRPAFVNGIQKKWLPCPVCHKTLSTPQTLKSHIQYYHKSYSAPSSSATHRNKLSKTGGGLAQYLQNRKSAKKHRKNSSQDEGLIGFECSHCGKILKNRPNLRSHVRMHTGERPFQCYFCPQRFHSHSARHRHKNICEFRHSATGISEVKVETTVRPNYKESESEDSENGSDFVDDSMEDQLSDSSLTGLSNGNRKPHHCKTCPRSFYSSASLISHGDMCSGTKSRLKTITFPHNIQLENNSIADQDSKVVDMTAPVGVDSSDEDIPLDRYRSKPDPEIPQTIKTDKKESLTCPYCSRVMARQDTLRDHIRCKHTGETPFKCSSCHRPFHTISALRNHNRTCKPKIQKIGRGVNDFRAPGRPQQTIGEQIVRRNFNEFEMMSKGNGVSSRQKIPPPPAVILDDPSNVSTDEDMEAYPKIVTHGASKTTPTSSLNCPYCNKLLNRKASLIVHIRLHTGEKPYKCSTCPMRFHDTIPLARHSHICDQLKAQAERRAINEERIRVKNFQASASSREGNSSQILKSGVKPKPKPTAIIEPNNQVGTSTWTPSATATATALKARPKSTATMNGSLSDMTTSPRSKSRNVPPATSTVIVNTPPTTSAYTCPECSKVLSSEACLEDHIRLHTGEKPFACPRCRQRFHSMKTLSQHKRLKKSCGVKYVRKTKGATPKAKDTEKQNIGTIEPQRREVNEDVDVEEDEEEMETETESEEEGENRYKTCPFCNQICFDVVGHIRTAHLNVGLPLD